MRLSVKYIRSMQVLHTFCIAAHQLSLRVNTAVTHTSLTSQARVLRVLVALTVSAGSLTREEDIVKGLRKGNGEIDG